MKPSKKKKKKKKKKSAAKKRKRVKRKGIVEDKTHATDSKKQRLKMKTAHKTVYRREKGRKLVGIIFS
jgi:hypothetical protein